MTETHLSMRERIAQAEREIQLGNERLARLREQFPAVVAASLRRHRRGLVIAGVAALACVWLLAPRPLALGHRLGRLASRAAPLLGSLGGWGGLAGRRAPAGGSPLLRAGWGLLLPAALRWLAARRSMRPRRPRPPAD